jgi:potassium-transporting ATPase KdpC subunit
MFSIRIRRLARLTMKTILTSLRLVLALTLLTGGIYPLVVWALARVVFPHQAEGSLVVRDGRVIGSELLAQDAGGKPGYFHPRPSAGSYGTVPSGASNQSWTSDALARAVAERRAAFPAAQTLPADLLSASGSGLDPDLSPDAIRQQVDRVAGARRLDRTQRGALEELIAQLTRGGRLTPARINVLALNLALDARFPSP